MTFFPPWELLSYFRGGPGHSGRVFGNTALYGRRNARWLMTASGSFGCTPAIRSITASMGDVDAVVALGGTAVGDAETRQPLSEEERQFFRLLRKPPSMEPAIKELPCPPESGGFEKGIESVVVADQKVYAPYNGSAVLIIHPDTHEVVNDRKSLRGGGNGNYPGCVYHPGR